MIGDGVGPALLPGGGIALPVECLADLLLVLRNLNREGKLTPELQAIVEVVATAAARAAGRRNGATWATPTRKIPAQGTRGSTGLVVSAQLPEGSDSAGMVGTTEAARALGVSPEWARQLAAGGRLPARRVGGRWLIDRAALVAHRDTKDGNDDDAGPRAAADQCAA